MSAIFEEYRLYTTVSIKTQSASATTKRALIDTGSVLTVINKNFLQSHNINLNNTGKTIPIHSIHGSGIEMIYEAAFIIDNVELYSEVILQNNIQHDIILGMNIIMLSDFYIHYNGSNQVEFDFKIRQL